MLVGNVWTDLPLARPVRLDIRGSAAGIGAVWNQTMPFLVCSPLRRPRVQLLLGLDKWAWNVRERAVRCIAVAPLETFAGLVLEWPVPVGFERQKRRVNGRARVPQTHVIVRSYLVDPASSHMLVSKIKPCMSKYKQHLYCETANGSLNQL